MTRKIESKTHLLLKQIGEKIDEIILGTWLDKVVTCQCIQLCPWILILSRTKINLAFGAGYGIWYQYNIGGKWYYHSNINMSSAASCYICGVYKGFWRSGAKGKAALPQDIWLHILVILFYPALTDRRNALPKESPKRNIQKEKIEIDKRRKHFFHTFLYLLGEGTNQCYVPRCSVVPKTPDSKMMLLVWRTLPDKTRFTENLSIYLSPPAPNSPLQNPSNFGATASHWLIYFLLFFFFFWFLTRWMRGALCMVTRLYILYVAADESTSGWEFYC